MPDKISVIVPIYNVEDYLGRCIDSILSQSYDEYELIMVDDCSTDSSATIAQEYEKTYSDKCKFIQRSQNGKLSATRNTGLRLATGKWICFIDSDDWVDKDYLKDLIEVANEDKSDIVACSYYHIWSNGYKVEIDPFGPLTTQSTQKQKVALMRNHAVTRLYRRQFIESSGLLFPEGIWRAAEMGFTIPLLTRTTEISILKKPLYYYYQRKSSNSNNNGPNIDLTFFDKAFDAVYENSMGEFDVEIEYRAVLEYLYGLTVVMIESGRSTQDIRDHVDSFERRYPMWKQNHYLKYMPKGKQTIVMLASRKAISVIRMLWTTRRRVSGLRRKGNFIV